MYKKLLLAFLLIPKIREGKGDVLAILSYRKDCEMYGKMINSFLMAPDQGQRLLKEWNKYIQMRNDEDFCIHPESKNYAEYQTMLDWKE